MPRGSGCGQSELGEKSMKLRRILKCLSMRSVSQHACILLSEFIGNYPTWSLASSRREKKKTDKNKPNQNTADCSMLSVGQFKGGGKRDLLMQSARPKLSPAHRATSAGAGKASCLPILHGEGPAVGWGVIPAPRQGPHEMLRWQLLLRVQQLWRL